MLHAVPFKGVTRFFNTEQDAIKFCKLAMIPTIVIIPVSL